MPLFWKHPLRALPVLLLIAAYAGAAFGAAGNVQFVIGDAKLITRDGVTRALQKGAEVNEGDRIVTAADASAQIKMVDGGFIAVRPNTNMGFDTYRYSGKEDGTENAIVSLLQGGFRTITGVIGRTNKQNYLIRTATATIGIRGTDHEPMVILAPAPGQVAIAPAGTYDKVNVGVAFIRTDAGSVDIQRNQVGFAPVSKAAPVILPKIPPFYKPTPAPGPQKAKGDAKDEGKKEAASAEIRDTATVDPATSAAAAAPTAAPVPTAPVVAITATREGGTAVNFNSTTPIVEPQGPIVGSPAVAADSYGFGGIAAAPVTGGVDLVAFGSSAFSSNAVNTNFVLSDNKLTEILQTPYQRFGLSSQTPALIANANIKFSGGTAADAFSDPNGTYYMGRWQGGQIAVADLATTSPVAPFADSLGAASVHWLVGLAPGNVTGTTVNNVQRLLGNASYSLAAATHPTDGFGNVGKLNSATLSADFSAQTVDSNLNLSFSSADAANPSKRNLSLTAAASKMPIQNASFGAAVIVPQVAGIPTSATGNNTVTCSGADCAAAGYVGTIGGQFLAAASGGSSSGAVGTGVGLNYGFIEIPTSASAAAPSFADYITGAAVLSTAAAPAASTSAVPVAGATGNYRHYVLGAQTAGNTTYNSNYSPATTSVVMNAQNYLFDASGNLARIQSTDYKLSDRGTSGAPLNTIGGAVPYTGSPGAPPSSPLANAAIAFSGGTAPDGNYNDTVNGIRMGRYTGGTITATDSSAPANPVTYSTQLGSNSFNWAVRELPPSIPTTGAFEYNLAYATKPTDSQGNVGTLNYASLSANFATQTVNPAVGITINNQTLSSTALEVPIGGNFGFDVSSSAAQNAGAGGTVKIACSGANCAPAPVGASGGYGGRFTGALAGAGTAGGAFFRYDFNTYYNPAVAAGSTGGIPSGETRPVNDYIQGQVAFTKGSSTLASSAPSATSGSQGIATSYFSPGIGTNPYYQLMNSNYETSATSYTNPFGAGSPNTVAESDPNNTKPRSETLTGGTVATAATNATSSAATGVSFGRYTGGTVSGTDFQGNTSSVANQASYAWLKGPDAFPMYLSGGLTGTATYALDGGTPPATTNGSTGTLNSAVLAVNFNWSAVGVDLSVTANGTNFAATSTPGGALTGNPSTNLKMNGDTSFFGSSFNVSNPAMHQSLYVTANGVSAPYYVGQVSGRLLGSGLSGAGLAYAFEDNFGPAPGVGVNGTVAFALNSYTTNGGVSTSGTTAIDPGNVPYVLGFVTTGLNADPSANPANAPASINGKYLTQIQGGFVASSRMARDAVSGLPTVWDSEVPVTISQNASCSPNPCPAFLTETPARYSILPTSFVATGSAPGSGQVALPAGKTPASLLEYGRDAATGISWGRYGGGVVALFDRVGGGFAPKAVDLTTQNYHGLFSPLQTGATALPITGTFTYTKVGGTSPTDNLGSAAGTLNAATLVADFGAQTVNAGVNLTVNGQTWAAGANAMPIQNRLYFEAGRSPSSGGNLNICVGGACGTATIPTASSANVAGSLVGGFTGTSGQGAGIAYSLNQGGIAGTTVSGVAAFKR